MDVFQSQIHVCCCYPTGNCDSSITISVRNNSYISMYVYLVASHVSCEIGIAVVTSYKQL